MATLTLTIPDNIVPRILARYGTQDDLKQAIRDMIKYEVAIFEREQQVQSEEDALKVIFDQIELT